MKNNFPILIFILVIVSACHKEVPQQKPVNTHTTQAHYYNLDPSILPYKFKVGSYWVYENDSTFVLDSIVVDSVSTGFITTFPNPHGTGFSTEEEFFKMYLHAFGSSKYYNECLIQKKIIRNFGGDFFHFLGQLIYLSNSPVGTSWQGQGMEITAKFLAMSVNSYNFNYVDEVKITAANQYQPEFAYDTYLYYTDTIGLIKKETILGTGNIESWSIKRWNVIK